MAANYESRISKVGEWLKNARKDGDPLKFEPTDVLIVGPTKSGTTWLQQILHQVRTGGDEKFGDIYDITMFCPEYIAEIPGYQIGGEQVAKPRIFKAHSSYEAIPLVEGIKLIVVVRDPTDAIWSLVKFVCRLYGCDQDLDMQTLQDLFKDPPFQVLPTWNFIANWYPHRADSNVLWLHYEDLIKDLKFCIREIGQFIGVPVNDAATLDRISHFCSFDYMSSHKEKFAGGNWIEAQMYLAGESANKWRPSMAMVRSDGGKVGQGREMMLEEMKTYVLQQWEESVSKPLGFVSYQKLYEQCSVLH